MRGWCPHCGELNEYARPPTTAIVYCQHCRKPFGAAALSASGGPAPAAQAAAPAAAQPRVPRRGPSVGGSAGGAPASRTPLPQTTQPQGQPPPPSSAPRRPVPPVGADPRPPAEDTRPPVRTSNRAVAAQVIVPKMTSKTRDSEQVGRAKLLYTSAEGLETEFELEAVNTLGRHPKNSIRLHDREVSKEHAVIELSDAGYTIRDLNSSNGTYVNGRRITEPVVLNEGDELLFGSMMLTFRVGEEADTRNSVRDLVTILPQEPAGATHIHAKLEHHDDEQTSFRPAAEVADPEALKRDYEKLRVAYELSRVGLTLDFSVLLQKTLDEAFKLLPADNGVILLVDPETGVLIPHTIKQREGLPGGQQEIVLSSTVVNQVINDRASVLLSDAILDPRFSGAQSIISQGIRSAMVVPLVANNRVHGVLHLDSRQRIGAFTEKDLQLLQALAGQAAVTLANSRLLRQVEQDAATRGQLSRFLSPHIVEQMVQGKGAPIMKGGREVDASVLFCDIRGFTTMSEGSQPQDIVDLLNDYFERLVEVVFQRHGVLDKFIGDALMAHWGTLEGDEDATFNAVAAALEFRDAIRGFNAERELEGLKPVGMGVGVNSGRLVAGYMGAKRRLEYTVIGDTVNTASRMCGLAKAGEVLISEATYQRVADRIEARYIGTRQVKGKEHGVEVYEALQIRGQMSQTGS